MDAFKSAFSSIKPPTNLWSGGGQQSSNTTDKVPDNVIVANNQQSTQPQTQQPNQERAIHRINLSSIRHNYNEVQTSAAQQQCQVIVVVKADGYGHGSLLTACHLVERCSAGAFAVATLEEGVALRRAFEEKLSSDLGSRVRILVLGSPVGYPKCFDTYLHNNIELMVSGPEVASSLVQWMKNHDGRRRAEAETVGEKLKEDILKQNEVGNPMRHGVVRQVSMNRDKANEELLKEKEGSAGPKDASKSAPEETISNKSAAPPPPKLQTKHAAATLTNMTGDDLAREVRQILVGQKQATAKTSMPAIQEPSAEDSSTIGSSSRTTSKNPSRVGSPVPEKKDETITNKAAATPFIGIADAAKASQQKEMRASKLGDEISSKAETPVLKKKLRWHALVDSGMGRLGFKIDEHPKPAPQASLDVVGTPQAEDGISDGSIGSSSEVSAIRDTVSIIKELYDAEVHDGAPIEFYGMNTHMAEANSTSTYTNDQMERFRSLLHRVRSAGIVVPSISTDNSSALLTTTLKHFHSIGLGLETRGYVRCGGAIYGQRPSFPQLRAVSTLTATVKHVAVIKQGESVGYDRAYVAPLDVRIATLTLGFADGYPRELGGGVGRVSIRGSVYPVAGNVCMDMLMVDLGPADIEGEGSSVMVGDTAVLWGPEETDGDESSPGLIPLSELAGTLKTTQSALTCGLSSRVKRVYI